MAEDEPATNGVPAREVARFLEESVRFAGEEWVDIFHTVSADPNLTVLGPEPGMLGSTIHKA